jgi:S-DNA-T family DNA segregation ATPase FtsK/SpoIIIE
MIVVAVDELTDLMVSGYGEQIEKLLVLLAQKSRAAGIHLILSTGRVTDVVTPKLKVNIPSRVSFALRSAKDSRGILDMNGAESLMLYGDMLYMPIRENAPLRVQCAYISEQEVQQRVSALRKAMPDMTYDADFMQKLREKSKLLPKADTAEKDDWFH